LASLLVTPVIAIASYSFGRLSYWEPNDYPLFGPVGASVLDGHWSRVFADSAVQSGPLELFPFGVAWRLGLTSALAWMIFYFAFVYLLTFFLVLTVYIALEPGSARERFYLGLLAAAVGCATGVLPDAVFMGHPSEVVVPMCWIVAATLARDRQFVLCGLLIGLSAGWEAWGVLGAPVIFLAARPKLVRAAIAGLVTVAVIYGPFASTGTFAMFGFNWPVAAGTLPNLLLPGLTAFPWSLRLLQAIVALGAGAAAAMWLRGTGYGIWLVPLAILSARLLLDPELYHYYWFAPAVVVIGLGIALVQQRRWVLTLVAAVFLAMLAFPSLLTAAGATVLLATTFAGVWVARRSLHAVDFAE
jgi:hypothetical protein